MFTPHVYPNRVALAVKFTDGVQIKRKLMLPIEKILLIEKYTNDLHLLVFWMLATGQFLYNSGATNVISLNSSY